MSRPELSSLVIGGAGARNCALCPVLSQAVCGLAWEAAAAACAHRPLDLNDRCYTHPRAAPTKKRPGASGRRLCRCSRCLSLQQLPQPLPHLLQASTASLRQRHHVLQRRCRRQRVPSAPCGRGCCWRQRERRLLFLRPACNIVERPRQAHLRDRTFISSHSVLVGVLSLHACS